MQASLRGYLVVRTKAQQSWWAAQCQEFREPVVFVRQGSRGATVVLDLDGIDPSGGARLSQDEYEELREMIGHVCVGDNLASRAFDAAPGYSRTYVRGVTMRAALQLAEYFVELGQRCRERLYPDMTTDEVIAAQDEENGARE